MKKKNFVLIWIKTKTITKKLLKIEDKFWYNVIKVLLIIFKYLALTLRAISFW